MDITREMEIRVSDVCGLNEMCGRIGDLTETFGALINGLGTELYPSAAKFIGALNLDAVGRILRCCLLLMDCW